MSTKLQKKSKKINTNQQNPEGYSSDVWDYEQIIRYAWEEMQNGEFGPFLLYLAEQGGMPLISSAPSEPAPSGPAETPQEEQERLDQERREREEAMRRAEEEQEESAPDDDRMPGEDAPPPDREDEPPRQG